MKLKTLINAIEGRITIFELNKFGGTEGSYTVYSFGETGWHPLNYDDLKEKEEIEKRVDALLEATIKRAHCNLDNGITVYVKRKEERR